MYRTIGRAAATLVAAAALLFGGNPALAGDPGRFTDWQTWPDWAARNVVAQVGPTQGELVDAIRFEVIKGIPNSKGGYQDRDLLAEREVTRGEFAQFLARSLELPVGQSGGALVGYFSALQRGGIVPLDASLDLGRPMTRLEAGQWIGRAAQTVNADDSGISSLFIDTNDPYVLRAARAGIVSGSDHHQFLPDRHLTRLEAALFVLRLARARNTRFGRATDVPDAIKQVIQQADQQASERERTWAETGSVKAVAPGNTRTEDFAAYLTHRMETVEQRDPWGTLRWHVQATVTKTTCTPSDDGPVCTEREEPFYTWKLLELHDTLAAVQVCGQADVYRDGQERPWYREAYCERQFLIWRDGRWLLASAGPATDSQ